MADFRKVDRNKSQRDNELELGYWYNPNLIDNADNIPVSREVSYEDVVPPHLRPTPMSRAREYEEYIKNEAYDGNAPSIHGYDSVNMRGATPIEGMSKSQKDDLMFNTASWMQGYSGGIPVADALLVEREAAPVVETIVTKGKYPLAVRTKPWMVERNHMEGPVFNGKEEVELPFESPFSTDDLVNSYRTVIGYNNPLEMTDLKAFPREGGMLTTKGREQMPTVIEMGRVSGNPRTDKVFRELPALDAATMDEPFHPTLEFFTPEQGSSVMFQRTMPTEAMRNGFGYKKSLRK